MRERNFPMCGWKDDRPPRLGDPLLDEIEEVESTIRHHEDELSKAQERLHELNQRRLVRTYPDPSVRVAVIASGDDG